MLIGETQRPTEGTLEACGPRLWQAEHFQMAFVVLSHQGQQPCQTDAPGSFQYAFARELFGRQGPQTIQILLSRERKGFECFTNVLTVVIALSRDSSAIKVPKNRFRFVQDAIDAHGKAFDFKIA